MRAETNPNLDELFAGAIGLAGDERSRFLDSRCGRDSTLRMAIEDLLRCHDAAGDFLEVPPITSLPEPAVISPAAPVEERMPARISHFRVDRVLGVGGMGRVYLAESEQPRRWVALKVIRSGLGSESLRRRFEQEAQVVALLQHPGIAQLYEAGTADTGYGAQPFFAMEYVDGPSLTEYARRRNLTTRGRLELFCRVCEAVDHAHRRGVIHRDLKPGNILVDATGQPKILDFGVARLTDPETGGGEQRVMTTLHTHAGQLIGTLSYMSPEQVAGDPSDVDARSDVYSLGVALYELLTGRLPHNVATCSIPEAIRVIREDAPASLSTIDRGLRGDIDTIVGKAIEKDAARRYQTAAELAGDIQRSLRDEPIVARPPSTWYQFSKFAKRNKALVGGTAATIMALTAGLVASVWQAREAEAAKIDAQEQAFAAIEARGAAENAKLAAQAKEQEANDARNTAVAATKKLEESLQVSQQINRFMHQLFSSPDPEERLGRDVKVMQILDRSSKHIDEELADQPHVRAVLHRTIGSTYRSLTAYAQAEAHLRAAYEIDLELYGEEHEETIESMSELVLVLSDQNKRREALELATREWGIAQRFFGPDDPGRLSVAGNLAMEMIEVGDWKGAEELQRFVLQERRRLLEPNDPALLLAMHSLGRTLGRTGRLREAEELQREAVARHRASGNPMSMSAFAIHMGLANTLLDLHRDDEAGEIADQLMKEGPALFHPEHNAMLTARNVRAQVLLHQNRLEEAVIEFRELVDLQSKSEIPAIDGHARVMNNLGEALRRQGRLDEAEAEFRKALKILDENEFVPDRLRIGLLNNLATIIRLKKDYGTALPIYKELVEVSERVLAPNDYAIGVSKYGYALMLLANRQCEESEQQLQGAYDIAIKTYKEQDEPVITIMRSFVNLYDLWQKKPGIEDAFRGSLHQKCEQWRAKLPEKYRND